MTKLKLIALAVALAPATAFAGEGGPGFAFTGGYGSMDGGGNVLNGTTIAMPTPYSHIDSDTSDEIFSVSATWFINENFGLELWTAQGAEQSVQIDQELGPDINIADFKTAPITLMAQYHFSGMGRFTPWVGAGWHWTNVSGISTNPAYDEVAGLKLSNDSGLTAAAGLDFALSNGWFARGDVRWMDSSTDVHSLDTVKRTVNTDKLYYGVALGYRF